MSNDTDAHVQEAPSPRAMALARAIRAARGAMPQMEFVEHANRPQSVVSNWENAKQTPSLETLAALEDSLGLPLGVLAARAGYFTADAAAAAGVPGVPISSLTFTTRSEAFGAVRAADALGLGIRLTMMPSGDGGASRWEVEVLPVDQGQSGQ